MSLVTLIVLIFVIGGAIWLADRLPAPWSMVARVALIIIAIVALLQIVGLGSGPIIQLR